MPNVASMVPGDWVRWIGVINGRLTMQGVDGAAWEYILPTAADDTNLAGTIYRIMKGPAGALSGVTSRHHDLKTKKDRHAGASFWIDQLLGVLPYHKIKPPSWLDIIAGNPTFQSITPNHGPFTGGTAVVIKGGSFSNTPTSATIQGLTLNGIQVVNDNTINGTTVLGTPGAADLVITNSVASVTAAGAYTYDP